MLAWLMVLAVDARFGGALEPQKALASVAAMLFMRLHRLGETEEVT